MKLFLKYLIGILVISAIIINIVFFGIVLTPKDIFHSTFHSVIQDKFRILKETNQPKIIFVAGSSGAFGLNQKLLEEATGYKVANLALHIGFGPLFYTELSKANINKGDIVLLGYEDGWYKKGAFDKIGVDLVMSGIDNHIDLYRYIPPKVWPQILGYVFHYANKKISYKLDAKGYSRKWFDSNTGQMIYPRKGYFHIATYRSKLDSYGNFNVKDIVISNDVIEYMRDYKKFVESRGARVFFVCAPHFESAMKCTIQDYKKLKQQEEEKIGISFISNQKDYVLPSVLLYDTIYHCNDRGEKYRTKLLIHDLYNMGIVPVKNIENYSMDKDDKLIFENDIIKYFSEIDDPSYAVFISSKMENVSRIPDQMNKSLRKLGVELDFANKVSQNFCAVIDNRKMSRFATNPSATVKLTGTLKESKITYSVSSSDKSVGNRSSIVINNQEHSRNDTGLNIVIVKKEDGSIVDTVSFDMSNGMKCCR